MKILLVDDEEEVLEAVKSRLENRGFVVVTANHAEKALKKIDSEEFDLLLMDVMLPGMSGAEAISLLKRNGKLKIPVIFVTGVFCKEGAQGINVGGQVYPALAKPFTIDELVREIEKAMMMA